MNLRGLIDKMQKEITGITKFTGSNGKKFLGRDSIQWETTGKRKFTGCNSIKQEITGKTQFMGCDSIQQEIAGKIPIHRM